MEEATVKLQNCLAFSVKAIDRDAAYGLLTMR
jgi:hypothetical protein